MTIRQRPQRSKFAQICIFLRSLALWTEQAPIFPFIKQSSYSPTAIPCIYILLNGFPVATMTGFVDPERLKENLDKAFASMATTDSGPSETAGLTSEEIEAHKQRIKEKLKALREKKTKQQEQDDTAQEKRRREEGRMMMENQQKYKQAQEMREREASAKKKNDEKAYQERLREQVRQEKLERQARNSSGSTAAASSASSTPSSAVASSAAKSSAPSCSCHHSIAAFC